MYSKKFIESFDFKTALMVVLDTLISDESGIINFLTKLSIDEYRTFKKHEFFDAPDFNLFDYFFVGNKKCEQCGIVFKDSHNC